MLAWKKKMASVREIGSQCLLVSLRKALVYVATYLDSTTNICSNPEHPAIRIEFHAGNRNFNKKRIKIKYNLLRRCPGPFQTQSPPISSIPGTGGTPCYTRIIDQRGTINTPFFPDPYPGPLDWIVKFQPGATSLKFHFHANGNNSLPTDNGFLINFQQVTEC
ncbi:hypothetical protein Avbf_04415 [Armadillidium vulgare]|nr:hypothetical protein Avbf_04415 [Armadillidium vulgare]